MKLLLTRPSETVRFSVPLIFFFIVYYCRLVDAIAAVVDAIAAVVDSSGLVVLIGVSASFQPAQPTIRRAVTAIDDDKKHRTNRQTIIKLHFMTRFMLLLRIAVSATD